MTDVLGGLWYFALLYVLPVALAAVCIGALTVLLGYLYALLMSGRR